MSFTPLHLLALAAALLLAACGNSAAPPALSVVATPPVVVPPPTPPPTPPLPLRSYAACYDAALTTASTVAGHACTWWHEALTQQNRLDDAQPLQNTLWIASHNSFNSSAYPGISSSGDPNHSLTLGDQLRLDMRGLELDVHWYLHAASGGFAPVLCHALGAETNHQGCASSDRHLREGLVEIANFLRRPENAGVVLMVDIEDQLQDYVPPNARSDSAQGHVDAIAAISAELGSLVYKPSAGAGCQPMPLTLSKAQVLASGAQIILTSGCNAAGGWNDWIFDIASIRQQKGNDGYSGPPDCGAPTFAAADYSQRWTRVWHDSTQLSAQTNPSLMPIDATTLRDMLACGLHMPSLDQLLPADARAEASIWSWAVNTPGLSSTRQCASFGGDAHFHAEPCTTAKPMACRSGRGWLVTRQAGLPEAGQSLCAAEFSGSRFGLPATGREAQALKIAANGAASLWLNYYDSNGSGDWRLLLP